MTEVGADTLRDLHRVAKHAILIRTQEKEWKVTLPRDDYYSKCDGLLLPKFKIIHKITVASSNKFKCDC